MNAKEFIEVKLRELASRFSDVKIRYEYRVNTLSHIIEVIPLSFFEKNEDYLIEEANIENKFEELFPLENIVFISKGSLTEIKNSDLEFGYDRITFSYGNIKFEFEVVGYSDIVEQQECENYALAA